MSNSHFDSIRAAMEFLRFGGHRIVTVELSRHCNRRCPYCEVPNRYNADEELTPDELTQLLERLHTWGYRAVSLLGGEPLSDHLRKEGQSMWTFTLEVVRRATSLGFFTNVTSNGDFVTKDKIIRLAQAGLGAMSLSLHSYTQPALDSLIGKLKLAAEYRIVPTLSTVFTAERSCSIPGVAAYTTRQGILFGIGLCQDYGGPFSKKCTELVPNIDQQQYVFSALTALKPGGFVRNNHNYLSQTLNYYPNRWKCDHRRDTFLHVSSAGKLGVCSDVRTDLNSADITDLEDPAWRRTKENLVGHCSSCLNQCYYEAQNPAPFADVPMFLVGMLFGSGKYRLVRAWAAWWTKHVVSRNQHVDWSLQFTHSQRATMDRARLTKDKHKTVKGLTTHIAFNDDADRESPLSDAER